MKLFIPSAALPYQFNMAGYCIGRPARLMPRKHALLVIEDAGRAQPSETWTFDALEDAVLRTAAALQDLGLQKGDRILIRLENTSAFAILFFAAIAGGFVAMPTSALLTQREVEFLCRDSGASTIAVSENLGGVSAPQGVRVIEAGAVARMMQHGRRAEYAQTLADDPAFLIYTSGTTARPKGVLHAHRSAWGRRPMYRGWYGIDAADRMLHAGAFNWTFTLGTGLTDPWANGATAIIYTGEKDPSLWPRLIAASGATLFASVPGLVRQILKYSKPRRQDLGALRHALIAGETPPPGLFEEWTGQTGLELYEALGMSEVSTFVSSSPEVPRKKGTIGKPQQGRRIGILPLTVEEGTELLKAGAQGLLAVHRSDPGLMLGYWQRPEEEVEVLRGEWFVGGDIATLDEEGYLTHHGRANDIMNAMGYRVSPLEVEAVLSQHPYISEVACAEIPVRDGISVIGAFVVKSTSSPVETVDIKNFAAERLALYKCPREIIFVETLPRTANGKVQRAALRKVLTG